MAEGALYPLLNRLEKDGKLSARWALEEGPHPRKYYRLNAGGAQLLSEMTTAWIGFRKAMTDIVETDR